MACAALAYGSGRASMRALSCLYCFFCSSDPVRASIHLAAMTTALLLLLVLMLDGVVKLFDPFGEEAPAPPELLEVLAAVGVERVDLARRALLGGDLLDVGEASLLDPDEQGVDSALDDVGEAALTQPRR